MFDATTFVSLSAGILVLAGIILLGYLILNFVWSRVSILDFLSFAFPLGGGAFTFPLFLFSWAGINISKLTVLLLLIGLIAVFIGLNKIIGPISPPEDFESILTIEKIAFVGLIIIIFFAAFISIGRSHSAYDGTAGWVVKGYGIAMDGDVRSGSYWGMWELAYPLNLFLLNGTLKIVASDVGPISKLIPTFFFLSILMVCYRFWRQEKVGRGLRIAAVFFLALHPLLFLHSTMSMANLPFATILISAVVLLITGFERDNQGTRILGGIFLGLAAWTRAEGLGYTLAILLVLFAFIILRRWRINLNQLLWLFLPYTIITIAWVVFGWSAVESSHLGGAMDAAKESFLQGEFHLSRIRFISALYFNRSLAPENSGYYIPIVSMLFTVGLFGIVRWRSPMKFSLIAYSFLLSAIPVGLFYVASFYREAFRELLIRSFDRAFIPGLFMIFILGIIAFNDALSGEQKLGRE